MRIDDDFDVEAAASMAIQYPKAEIDQAEDAVTARKVDGTIRDMFETTLSRPNAFNKLDESIVRYFSLLSKMATDKRNEIKKEKDLYEKTYKLAAKKIPEIANNKLTFAILSVPPSLLGMSPNRLDNIAGERLSQTVVPSLGAMFSAGKEAEMNRANAVSQLAMQELNNQTSQAEGNEKSGLDQILANKNNAVKEAARGMG